MTRRVVDYENLMDTSFSDANAPTTLKTSLRPRWERKKLEKQEQQTKSILGSRTNSSSSSSLSASTAAAATNATTQTGDRFIPHRSTMDRSKHLLRTVDSFDDDDEVPLDEEDLTTDSIVADKKDAYQASLQALLGVDSSSRILSYQDKAPVPTGDTLSHLNVLYSVEASNKNKSSVNTTVSRHIPSAPSRILDAPDLKDDYYLNLVSWSDTNVLAVALGSAVYLWDASDGSIHELCECTDHDCICSVAWVQQGGTHLAVGLSNGTTQLWDVVQQKMLRRMEGHVDRVGSLAWNRHVLTTGSRDASIVHHDVRIADHETQRLTTHTQEVCSLAWSSDGQLLASGANDNVVCLWNHASSSRSPQYRWTDHQAAVKALAWSPHERHLLATGAGTADRCIKLWSSSTGALLNSVDTGSQVCALVWNPYTPELLSSHGYARNQLTLWKYPSMTKIQEFEGHSARVLHLVQHEGCVLSAGADETLRFWNMFEAPAKSKTTKTTSWTRTIR